MCILCVSPHSGSSSDNFPVTPSCLRHIANDPRVVMLCSIRFFLLGQEYSVRCIRSQGLWFIFLLSDLVGKTHLSYTCNIAAKIYKLVSTLLPTVRMLKLRGFSKKSNVAVQTLPFGADLRICFINLLVIIANKLSQKYLFACIV